MVDREVHGGFVSWSRRGVLLVGVGLLAGCGAVDDLVENRSQLPVLLEDPMAAEDLLGLTLKESSESGYRRPLGKPKFTEVRRVFSLGDDDRQEVFDRAVAFAKESGWKKEFESGLPLNMVWNGQKNNPRCECGVFISDNDTADLMIRLRVFDEP